MIANITSQLLLVLVLVAALGIAIGATLMQIRAVHTKNKQVQHHKISTEKLRDQLSELESRHAALQRSEKARNQLLSASQNKEEQATAQQDALQVHARLQAQRIVNLEASLLAAEERGLRFQRDFESYKNHKQQELSMLRKSAALGRESKADREGKADNDLPVLNKRVAASAAAAMSARPAAASVQAMQALFRQELDIPALAESELAGSISDIDFDMAFDELLEGEVGPVG